MNAARAVMISAYARGFVPGMQIKLAYTDNEVAWFDAGRIRIRLAVSTTRHSPLVSLWSPIV